MSPEDEIREVFWRAEQLMRREPAESVMPRLLTVIGLKVLSDAAEWFVERGYRIPEEAQWTQLKRAPHLYRAIVKALEGLAQNHPSWQWLAHADPVWFAREDVLSQLMLLIDTVDLGITTVEDWATLGRQVETVLDRTPSRWMEERQTAPLVNALIAALLAHDLPPKGGTIYDPTCGVGGTLVSAGSLSQDLTYYGQDTSSLALYGCTWNFLLHGITRFHLAQGDVLTEPRFLSEDRHRVQVFDCVVADPPWGLIREIEWGPDPYQRFRYGALKGRRADYGFLQHVLASLQTTGVGMVLMPPGVLFRSGYEQDIRQNLVQADVIDTIVILPGGALLPTASSAALWVLRLQKPEERRQRIRMVDASGTPEKRRRVLDEGLVSHIVQAVRGNEPEPGFARTVSHEEIATHEFRLVPGEYVTGPVEVVSPSEMWPRVQKAEDIYTEAQRSLAGELLRLDELLRTTG